MIRPIVLRQHGIRNGSGAMLARALGIGHSSPRTPRRSRRDRFVINWGVSEALNWTQRNLRITNTNTAISNCVNKLETLKILYRHPEVQNIDFAVREHCGIVDNWLREDGKLVVRHTVTGHSGQGIQIVRKGEEIPQAPLYTRYFKKSAEYRVHVAFGKVIHIQQKKRSREADRDNRDANLIRTNGNGWAFCITDLDCDSRNYRESISTLALNAAKAVYVEHGAVDILTRHKEDGSVTSVVCEINSAPALRNPSTCLAWVTAFKAKFAELGIVAL